MIFADHSPEHVPAWRESLALWSDILGVLAFLFSVLGFGVSLWINNRIKKAKNDARLLIEGIGKKLLQQELVDAKQNLVLAKEHCLTSAWTRAEIHLDIAIDRLTRQLQHLQPDDSERQKLWVGTDDVRVLRDEVRSQKREKQGSVSPQKLKLLDSLIRLVIECEGRSKSSFWENKP